MLQNNYPVNDYENCPGMTETEVKKFYHPAVQVIRPYYIDLHDVPC